MRESFTYGSVRGAGSNPSPYRDRRAAKVGGVARDTGRLGKRMDKPVWNRE